MLTDTNARLVAKIGANYGVKAVPALAVIEVETAGSPFEADGRTPRFLFERHQFYRMLNQQDRKSLPAAVRQGLAIPKWSPSTQYKDQATSAGRMALIARARAINEECANDSASWGIGQVMGFNAKIIGCATATEMVEAMADGGLETQIDFMFREFKHDAIIDALNNGEWAKVARIYNGSGYATNRYDVKLAAAFAKWSRKWPTISKDDLTPARETPPEQKLTAEQVKAIQIRLRKLGYTEVGEPGGGWDSRCAGAVSAFQAHEGLPQTGHYDSETAKVLFDPETQPREVAEVRKDQTADDLRDKGSRTIKHADRVSLWGKIKLLLGLGSVGGGVADKSGLLDHAQEIAEKGSALQSLAETFKGLFSWVFTPEGTVVLILLIGGGIFLIWQSRDIIRRRLEDHQSGVHAGPVEEIDDETAEVAS